MYLEWTDSLSVAHPTIDGQHRELIDAINGLLEAMAKGSGKQEVVRLTDFLADYVVKHFGAEEELMRKHGYADLAAHKAAHDGFVQTFLAMKPEIEAAASAVAVLRIQRVVCDWVRDHIMRVDKKLGAFLQERKAA